MEAHLTIKHLAPYQEHKVKLIDHLGNKCNISYLSTKKIAFIDINGIGEIQKLSWEYATRKIKPILKPLSDYININSKAMNDLNIDVQDQIELRDFADKKIGLNQVSYGLYEIMCINHIDFNRLIEKGLAISYNDIS